MIPFSREKSVKRVEEKHAALSKTRIEGMPDLVISFCSMN
jgi:hypothetical protein